MVGVFVEIYRIESMEFLRFRINCFFFSCFELWWAFLFEYEVERLYLFNIFFYVLVIVLGSLYYIVLWEFVNSFVREVLGVYEEVEF